MTQNAALDGLKSRLEDLHAASWQMFAVVDPVKRPPFVSALAGVSDAWQALERGLAGDERDRLADATASVLGQIGDHLFYGRGLADEAIVVYELALSVTPIHTDSLLGIVAAYLQGSDRRPQAALPYAERLARMDPRRQQSVDYIRSLIAKGE